MGGGSGSVSVGRPAEVVPVVSEVGLNIYSGPTSSLAGSLPSWIAWFGSGITYELGSLVHFNGTVSTYQSNEDDSIITSAEYDNMDLTQKQKYTATGDIVMDRSLLGFNYGGSRYGSQAAVQARLQNVLRYFDYSKETIYVCVIDGATLDLPEMDDPSTRKNKGFWSLEELEQAGWTTGFNNDTLASGETSPQNTLKVDYDEVILNLADITASYVTSNAMGTKPSIVKCKAVFSPGANSTEPNIFSKVDSKRSMTAPTSSSRNYDLGISEFAIIPSDQLSFGGGLVRTPNSQLEDVANRAGEAVQSTDSQFLSTSSDHPLTEDVSDGAAYAEKMKEKMTGLIDPRYGKASTSLNAFLASVYTNAYPQASGSEVKYWVPGVFYEEGQVVRYAFDQADADALPVDRLQKDFLWICREDHTSSNSNRPPFISDSTSQDLAISDEWQSYTRLINQPNTSLGDLHELYKDAGLVLPFGLETFSENLKLSDKTNTPSPRKRMSDLIGGSRLYGHLTMGPMGALTSTHIYTKYRCRYSECTTSFGYLRMPPDGTKPASHSTGIGATDAHNLKYLAGLDLWLFPNNFKKDHAGQIKYAISFFDHVDYNIQTSWGVKKRGFFARLFSFFLGRKNYNWSRVERFSRQHFQTITNLKGGKRASVDTTRTVEFGGNAQTLPSLSNEFEAEDDIIRFSFRYLVSHHDQLNLNNVLPSDYFASGYYEVTIQDLNSGTMLKPSFKYQDFLSLPNSDVKDSFGLAWNSRDRATMNNTLWREYNKAADDVVSKFNWVDLSTGNRSEVTSKINQTSGSDAESRDLKLLTTRNWFNWLILGPETIPPDVFNPQNNYQPLIIRSMDIEPAVFDNLCGLVHTGFRSMNFDQIRQDTVDFAFPDVLKESASAARLPSTINQTGDKAGFFNVSEGINNMPEKYIQQLIQGSVPWVSGEKYKPGDVVNKDGKYYYIQETLEANELPQ